MAPFTDTKTLQRLVAVHASRHNYLNHDHPLNSRETFRQKRSALPVEASVSSMNPAMRRHFGQWFALAC